MFSKKLNCLRIVFFFFLLLLLSNTFPFSLLQIFAITWWLYYYYYYNAKVFLSNWRVTKQYFAIIRLKLLIPEPSENSFKTTRKILTLYLSLGMYILELKFASAKARDFTDDWCLWKWDFSPELALIKML